MKRQICFVLALLLICSLLSACGQTAEIDVLTQPTTIAQPSTAAQPTAATLSTTATQPTKETDLPITSLQKSDPSQDDTLNILMIGSSFCYYYVEELWGMLDAAGIKARVCNVYYSACSVKNHWSWWKSDEAHYEFYVTDENGRVKTDCTNLEYCLKQENWDIISLQESTHEIRREGAQLHFASTKEYLTDLWDYIKTQFPLSRYLWHQPWAYQVGADKNGVKMMDLNQQLAHTLLLKDYAMQVCNAYELERVNTGEAWHLVRQAGYDSLCARLGINGGLGDYSHDGDIGGGQYLNACVWYEIVTGQSCLENPYQPVYRKQPLPEDLITLLQESAHQAVLSRNAE